MLLQRVASNAYSWWWASHIRTTQSKWLDANLQEMEHRVKTMLKLLGEEADSFGKRAEMYYRRRPEVINHVEQVYRAYRALVERYDHLSKELHKANHTIATACPEQVQYAMLEEEDDSFPKAVMPINSHKIQKSTVEDILKRKREGSSGRNKGARERSAPDMNKDKAEEEISKLQKAILVLQTEKEFVKSSYESGIAKYWEIEKEISDTQEEICHIQDEFDAHAAIEDDEARALMTMTALRSCQGMVSMLVENFEELIRVAKMESEKIKSLREKLYSMNCNIDPSTVEAGATNMTVNNRVYPNTQAILELQHIYEKIEILFDNNSESAEEMAEKVDELVDKVMNLELKFPKQYAQIKQLKEENEKLKNKLDDLQDEMALRDDPSDLGEELKLAEDELNRMSVLERSISEEEVLLSTAFSEVFSCIVNMPKAFEPIDPDDLASLPDAAGDEATPSEDVCIENFMKYHTSNKGGKFRDIEVPTTPDNLVGDRCSKEDVSEMSGHDSPSGTDGIHGSRSSDGGNILTWSSLVQEEFRDKESIPAGNHVDLIVSSGSENVANKTFEGQTDTLLQVCESSSGGLNKNWHMGNDGIENFAQGEDLKVEHPPVTDSQTHLLHSESINTLNNEYDYNEKGLSMEVAESSFGGGNKTQNLTIDVDENPVHRNSLIQDEHRQNSLVSSTNLYSFSKEDTTEENSLPEAAHSRFSDADKGQDLWHADETESVEELPKQGTSENMIGLNECSKVNSSEEGYGASLGHVNIIEDLKGSLVVGAYSSEVSVKTSLCVPNKDSEGTEGMYQLVSKEPINSERMASHIPHSQLKRKISDVKVLAREARTLSSHGSRSQRDKSSLIAEEDVPSWQEFLLDGLEGRDAILLADYTSVLQNYKETKRRLAELEKKNQEHLEETKAVIRELRNANSLKYVEIQSLRNLLDSSEMPPSKMGTDRSNQALDREISIVDETNFSHTGAPENASPFEVKLRTEIDALVEENLQSLVRYSMACHRMQDLDRKYQELQNEMENSAIREPEHAEKKMGELKTEVAVWFEQNALVDQDLQVKTTSLCTLQGEIAEALRAGSEIEGARFTPYEAAKLQGEVLNMQQYNNKMESELQAALERMRELEGKVSDALRKQRESFELSSRMEAEIKCGNQFKHFPSRRRVPLRNFLFGTKPKKKSIFACINPALQKQLSGL